MSDDNKVKPLIAELQPNGQWSLAKSWDKVMQPNSKGEKFHVLSSDNKYKAVKEIKGDHYHTESGDKIPMQPHSQVKWIHPENVEANNPKGFDSKAELMRKAESEMAYANITELAHHIKEIKSNLSPGEELPEWVEAKLTLAADYLSTIAHYIDGKKTAGLPLAKTATNSLDLLKGELIQLKGRMAPKIKSSASEVKKDENTMDYGKMKSMTTRQIQTQNEANAAVARTKLGVGQGSGPNTIVSSAPRVSGIAGKYEMGRTRSGKIVNSHTDHPSHESFGSADHNDAMAYHKNKRDELRADPGVNKDLVTHHQNAAEFHSKAGAAMRMSGSGIK